MCSSDLHEGQHILTKPLLDALQGTVRPSIQQLQAYSMMPTIARWGGRPDATNFIMGSTLKYGPRHGLEEAISVAKEAITDPKVALDIKNNLVEILQSIFRK